MRNGVKNKSNAAFLMRNGVKNKSNAAFLMRNGVKNKSNAAFLMRNGVKRMRYILLSLPKILLLLRLLIIAQI